MELRFFLKNLKKIGILTLESPPAPDALLVKISHLLNLAQLHNDAHKTLNFKSIILYSKWRMWTLNLYLKFQSKLISKFKLESPEAADSENLPPTSSWSLHNDTQWCTPAGSNVLIWKQQNALFWRRKSSINFKLHVVQFREI